MINKRITFVKISTGEIDARIEQVPISLESYENDTWVPLIYEIRTKGLE